jgi:hypothetical protein
MCIHTLTISTYQTVTFKASKHKNVYPHFNDFRLKYFTQDITKLHTPLIHKPQKQASHFKMIVSLPYYCHCQNKPSNKIYVTKYRPSKWRTVIVNSFHGTEAFLGR